MEVSEVPTSKRRRYDAPSRAPGQVGGKGRELLEQMGWMDTGLGKHESGRTAPLRLQGTLDKKEAFDLSHFSGVYGNALAKIRLKADAVDKGERIEWWHGHFVRSTEPLTSIPMLVGSRPLPSAPTADTAAAVSDAELFAKCEGRRARRSHKANTTAVAQRKQVDDPRGEQSALEEKEATRKTRKDKKAKKKKSKKDLR